MLSFMKQKIWILALSAVCAVSANAVIVQKVQLKNGSELEGYIQRQDKNDNITFCSDRALITVNQGNAQTTESSYTEGNLDQQWVEWGNEHDAFSGTGADRTLVLNDIIFQPAMNVQALDSADFDQLFVMQHPKVSKVKVLEKGAKIKYLELSPNTYSFNWRDVESITADRRPKTQLTGIDRIYQLHNGSEVKGQYAGEAYTTLSLYSPSGVVETFNLDDVDRYRFKAINPNQTLFDQSELIDVVRTKNGTTYRGIITERDFTEGNNYLVLQQESGSEQTLKFNDVVEYSKEENPNYQLITDVLLKPGEMVINRLPVEAVGVTKNGTQIVLEKINPDLSIPQGDNVTRVAVEYYNPQNVSSDNYMLVKVDEEMVKKAPVYSFSTDLFELQKFVPVNRVTSVNGTTKLEYDLPGNGVFAVYDLSTRQAIPFNIIDNSK